MSGATYRRFIESSAIQGANAAFIEAEYEDFLDDPESVAPEWRAYFRLVHDADAPREIAHSAIVARFERIGRDRLGGAPAAADTLAPEAAQQQAGVLRLINYYRVRGHQAARLDPLGVAVPPPVPDLDLAFHGLSDADLDTEFNTGSLAAQERLPLRDIVRLLRSVYTDTVGAEYMHITETSEKRWIQSRLEGTAFQPRLPAERRQDVLRQLAAAEGLERFLHNKYVGQKRFSLEGGDCLIPALDQVLRSSAERKVEELVIGMAHRGRLNVLVNVLGKSPKDLFDEFEGKYDDEELERAGDVKYHMGFSTDVDISGNRLHLVLAFNPSHLEIVNPVVEGSVKARQTRRGDDDGDRVVPILIHGDAAFAGQGVVMETLQLSQAKGYSTGGTVHFIVNNQIGFTTPNPIEARPWHEARSSRYCTDIAKMLEAPVFHVNGDDPEAVVFVSKLAMDYRNEFHSDVIVDLCCYRRLGHNEADEPSVTSPVMYAAIKKHPTPYQVYSRRLIEEGVIGENVPESLIQEYREGLDQGHNIVRTTLGMVGNKYTVNWKHYTQGEWDSPAETAVPADTIQTLSKKLVAVPDGFNVHPRVRKVIEGRQKMAAGEQPMDWGFAECMAYASLVNDGFAVRLCGQDARRGTFFHRHATLYDGKTGKGHTPMRHVSDEKNAFIVNDTLLSEEGVLGFEYGYSTTDPDSLVVWEAQFGDFANGAQVVTDQFIAAGQAKWARFCGLTLFLPHGYEGQGPEHSSARLERFLQLCAQNNMQVCVPTTPAQMFHMLRRQMKRSLRMPLVVMTPKSLLRHPRSVSPLSTLHEGRFEPLIAETADLDDAGVKRVVFCSGKVYYDLLEGREKAGLDSVALVRLEQVYPFPRDAFLATLERYGKATEIVWCQEEPENQGAWYQIKHKLLAYIGDQHELIYASRWGTSTTAVGYLQVHRKEQEWLVQQALTAGKREKDRVIP